MKRIQQQFNRLRASGRKALIPYITAGDPDPAQTVDLMHGLVAAGADIIELGVPFTDPMADGPVIQAACERALASGTSLHTVLKLVETFRQQDSRTPVVLMGYMNPFEAMGVEAFAAAAEAAGVDGVLTVDLPPEEAGQFAGALSAHQLDAIFLLSPATSMDRVKLICEHGSGYVYYVSLKGVTGSAALNIAAVTERIAQIREVTDLAVGVGFGISTPEAAASVARIADGVIVGSALVKRIEESRHNHQQMRDRVTALLASMREAMDSE